MKRSGRFLIAACMMLMAAPTVRPVAQTVLTLEECRTMALENNSQSKMAREKVAAAEYDSKTAFFIFTTAIISTLLVRNSETRCPVWERL